MPMTRRLRSLVPVVSAIVLVLAGLATPVAYDEASVPNKPTRG